MYDPLTLCTVGMLIAICQSYDFLTTCYGSTLVFFLEKINHSSPLSIQFQAISCSHTRFH